MSKLVYETKVLMYPSLGVYLVTRYNSDGNIEQWKYPYDPKILYVKCIEYLNSRERLEEIL